ncbi:unnamed protein product [Adineta steineri]|uniref:Peptidase C1A papain C-terminal domain-containing protein n=1 Tax=Adineta steineri TaxID=433720 RepID=A0A816D5K5_9BILA|nr:unnamed protein product [Adineta steineri]
METKYNQVRQVFVSNSTVSLPDSVDWRNQNVVEAVKDQGSCGACWAFSAVGSIESAYAIKTGTLVSLSEQQLVDCSRRERNYGCGGGWMDHAFVYVITASGIETESSYPYAAVDQTCVFNPTETTVQICDFVDIASGDEVALQQAVATIGPISVAIDAGRSSFQFYQSGVYNEPTCLQRIFELDHAVLLIGYGTDGNHDYWLVKNSWSTDWGDQGYMKMTRNQNNQCGIATAASYPIICSTNTQPVQQMTSDAFYMISNMWLVIAEATSSLELTGTNEGGFILSIKSDDETDAVKYFSVINSIFKELKISTLHLHKAILSENLWNTIRQLVVDSQHLEEMIMDCPSTLNETREWLFSLCKNESLKILHKTSECLRRNFSNVGSKKHFGEIFSHVFYLSLENSNSMLTGIVKWCTNKNSDIKIIKKFLQIIPVHHLSLDLANINCETLLKQLTETINQLPLLKTLELQKSNATVTHLQFVGRIEEIDMTTSVKAFRNNKIISHLSLKEIEISLLNLRQILDMSYVNRRLRVLEIHHCTSDSDRNLFEQEIKQSCFENRTLEILFEN